MDGVTGDSRWGPVSDTLRVVLRGGRGRCRFAAESLEAAVSEMLRVEKEGGCVEGELGDAGDLFVGVDWASSEGDEEDEVCSGAGDWAGEGESAAISFARGE